MTDADKVCRSEMYRYLIFLEGNKAALQFSVEDESGDNWAEDFEPGHIISATDAATGLSFCFDTSRILYVIRYPETLLVEKVRRDEA